MAIRRFAVIIAALVSLLSVPMGAAVAESGGVVEYRAQPAGWGGFENAYFVSYRTEGPTGAATTATGAVFVPPGTAPDGGWPVVAWAHGTSGLGPTCGVTPSAAAGDGWIVERLLSAGYAVATPDYLGLGPGAETTHPYLQSRTEATATIDLVRAAVRSDDSLSSSWAVAGVSQGGHAALNAGHLASSYAPELDFRGTVAMAPASNFETVFALAGPHVPSVDLLNALTPNLAALLGGLQLADPDFPVRDYLTPSGQRLVADLATKCVGAWGDSADGASIGSILARPLGDPPFASRLSRYMAVPTAGYDRPIFVAHGVPDTTVPIPLTLALLAQFDAAGTRYEFRSYDSDHQKITADSLPDAITFLHKVLPAR
ncbi:hypothetical protein IU487_34435 [Nocardia puris]|uniref:Secretory lipase n=1 Tax=Nocardia puris TaxID=208602 RepID=A0A366E3Z4_9NOCA|nr:lipase family protein [Nocardia puris]MBF6216098.1 hypothetical protein [Nocardia puris]RBO97063.1 secretory lipase [Nocardia puris]